MFKNNTKKSSLSQLLQPLDLIKGEFIKDSTTSLWHLAVLLHSSEDWDYLTELENTSILRIGSPLIQSKWQETRRKRKLLLKDEDYDPYCSYYDDYSFTNDFSCYRTIEKVFQDIQSLVTKYPDLVSTETIGQTHLKQQQNDATGFDIPVLRITIKKSNKKKAPILIVAGMHPRELQPPELVMRLAEHLVSTAATSAQTTWLLDYTEFHLIPILNLDTRYYVQESLSSYLRKNQRVTCPEAKYRIQQGVDLNRNLPFAWGNVNGASANTCEATYFGKEALSEPETKALYDYAARVLEATTAARAKPLSEAWSRRKEACPEENNAGLFIDIHSYGNYIVYPWSYDDVHPPNQRGVYALASKLAFHGNYKLWGPFQDSPYSASGVSTDTAYGVFCVNAAGFELGNDFYEDCEHFESETTSVALAALLYGARTAPRAFQIPRGPDIRALQLDRETKILTVEADESEMTIFDSTTVRTIRVYINQHPYDDNISDGSIFSMIPSDGAFDSERETATLVLPLPGMILQVEQVTLHEQVDTQKKDDRKLVKRVTLYDTTFRRQLQEGAQRMVVFVEAENAEGYRGVIEAFFVDVVQQQQATGMPSLAPTVSLTQPPTAYPTPNGPSQQSLQPTVQPVIPPAMTNPTTEQQQPGMLSTTMPSSANNAATTNAPISETPSLLSEIPPPSAAASKVSEAPVTTPQTLQPSRTTKKPVNPTSSTSSLLTSVSFLVLQFSVAFTGL